MVRLHETDASVIKNSATALRKLKEGRQRPGFVGSQPYPNAPRDDDLEVVKENLNNVIRAGTRVDTHRLSPECFMALNALNEAVLEVMLGGGTPQQKMFELRKRLLNEELFYGTWFSAEESARFNCGEEVNYLIDAVGKSIDNICNYVDTRYDHPQSLASVCYTHLVTLFQFLKMLLILLMFGTAMALATHEAVLGSGVVGDIPDGAIPRMFEYAPPPVDDGILNRRAAFYRSDKGSPPHKVSKNQKIDFIQQNFNPEYGACLITIDFTKDANKNSITNMTDMATRRNYGLNEYANVTALPNLAACGHLLTYANFEDTRLGFPLKTKNAEGGYSFVVIETIGSLGLETQELVETHIFRYARNSLIRLLAEEENDKITQFIIETSARARVALTTNIKFKIETNINRNLREIVREGIYGWTTLFNIALREPESRKITYLQYLVESYFEEGLRDLAKHPYEKTHVLVGAAYADQEHRSSEWIMLPSEDELIVPRKDFDYTDLTINMAHALGFHTQPFQDQREQTRFKEGFQKASNGNLVEGIPMMLFNAKQLIPSVKAITQAGKAFVPGAALISFFRIIYPFGTR